MSILLAYSWLVAVLLLQKEPCFAAQPGAPASKSKRGRTPPPTPLRRSSLSKGPRVPSSLSVFTGSSPSDSSAANTAAGGGDSGTLDAPDAAASSALSQPDTGGTGTAVSRSPVASTCSCWGTSKTDNSSDQGGMYKVASKKADPPLTAPETTEGATDVHSPESVGTETQQKEVSGLMEGQSLASADTTSISAGSLGCPPRRPVTGGVPTPLVLLNRPAPRDTEEETGTIIITINEFGGDELGADDGEQGRAAVASDDESEGAAATGTPIPVSGDGHDSSAKESAPSQVQQEGAEGGPESGSPVGSPDKEGVVEGVQHVQASVGVATTLSPEQTLRMIAHIGKTSKGLPVSPKTHCAPGLLNQAMWLVSGQMFTFLNFFAKYLREQRQQSSGARGSETVIHEAAMTYQRTLEIHDTGVSDEQPEEASAFLDPFTQVMTLVVNHPSFPEDKALEKGLELAVKCASEEGKLTLSQAMACLLQISLSLAEMRRTIEKTDFSSQGCAGQPSHSDDSPPDEEGRCGSDASTQTAKGRGGTSLLSKLLRKKYKDAGEREDENR